MDSHLDGRTGPQSYVEALPTIRGTTMREWDAGQMPVITSVGLRGSGEWNTVWGSLSMVAGSSVSLADAVGNEVMLYSGLAEQVMEVSEGLVVVIVERETERKRGAYNANSLQGQNVKTGREELHRSMKLLS